VISFRIFQKIIINIRIGVLLSEILKDIAELYLDDESIVIRKAGALTCCYILSRDPIAYQSSDSAVALVSDIVSRLLTLAVADLDSTIRLAVLSSLDETFDHHLVQAEPIHSLFLAVNDEVFAIREVTVEIIGRLSLLNPAYVLPPLRRLLIKLLTEIEYCDVR
jgi:FKBP12-rapamycin complex-associated protein